jgi:hypothetical protein
MECRPHFSRRHHAKIEMASGGWLAFGIAPFDNVQWGIWGLYDDPSQEGVL